MDDVREKKDRQKDQVRKRESEEKTAGKK